jgi:hypothetical protein
MRLFIAILLVSACGSDGGGKPPLPDGGGSDDGGPAPDAPVLSVEDAGPGQQPRFVEYIRSTPYDALELEIDYVPGFEPRAAASAELVQRVSAVVDKPGGVFAVLDETLASRGADHAWTFSELAALADATFDDDGAAGTIAMHVLFVDGHYASDTDTQKILGIAWSHTHLTMFKQTIDATCSSMLVPPLLEEELCTAAELSIWTHEVGHLLGLVDNGLPMVTDHRDPDHGKHDVDDACVMYWAYEGQDVVGVLADRLLAGEDTDLVFDDACLADIAAVRDQ